MAYELKYNKKAIKVLSKLNAPHYSALIYAIDALAENPYPNGHKKLKGREGYRVRVGNYRIIYSVYESELVVEIITLGHREDVYE